MRTIQATAEMKRYNLAVLGISESNWTQVEQERLALGEVLWYSGYKEEDASHT